VTCAGAASSTRGVDRAYTPKKLLARGGEVVAIDASEPMLELARKRLGPSVDVRRADLNEPLAFDDERFELVICPLVIHHVNDRAAVLREFFRVLRPGGNVVLSTQHPTTDWLRKGGSYFDVREEEDVWKRGDDSYTVRFWREPLTSLCAAVAEAGFLIERLVEPLPVETMRERWPEEWGKAPPRARLPPASPSQPAAA